MAQCTAKSKRTGEQCRANAMYGRTVCYHHGGKAGRPVIHGRYSQSVPKDMAERYEYFKTDPDILSLKPEIALARAHFERFMRPIIEGAPLSADTAGELRAWHETISRLTERCHKILYGDKYTITVQGLSALTARIVDIINTSCEANLDADAAEKLKQSIAAGLAELLPTGD